MWGDSFTPTLIGRDRRCDNVGVYMAQLNPADRKAARELAAKLETPGISSYGSGLILKVDKRGGAYWVCRLQLDGKRRDIGLGSAKLMSEAKAREEAKSVRTAIKIESAIFSRSAKTRKPRRSRSSRRRNSTMRRTRAAGKARYIRASGSLALRITCSRS